MRLVACHAVMGENELSFVDVVHGDHRTTLVGEGVAGEALHYGSSGRDHLIIQPGMFPIWSHRLPIAGEALEARERGICLQFFGVRRWLRMDRRRHQQQQVKQCQDALDRHMSFSLRAASAMLSPAHHINVPLWPKSTVPKRKFVELPCEG